MNKKTISILLAIAIFVVGVLFGFVVNSTVALKRIRPIRPFPSRRRAPEKLGQRFCRSLNLDEKQKEKLHRILEKKREAIEELKKKMAPEFEKIKKSFQIEIKSILNDGQKKKFEKLYKKFEGEKKKFAHRKFLQRRKARKQKR